MEVLAFILQGAFLTSFFSGFLSSLLVATLVSIVAYFFTNVFHSPQPTLLLVAKQNGLYSESILLMKQNDGTYKAEFQLAIKNDGNLTFKKGEGFWHTYVRTDDTMSLSVPGEIHHQRGLIEYPIYPKYFVDITGAVYRLIIQEGDNISEGIPYFFVTDYGYFPRTVEFDQNNGQVLFKTMGLLKFELSQ